MKRVAATLVIALVLVGCGALLPETVHLLTVPADEIVSSSLRITGGPYGCVSNPPNPGELVADATYGTAFATGGGDAMPLPVVWPSGFTGRRSGSEVQVINPQGNVVAVTGHVYVFNGGSVSNGSTDAVWVWSGLPVPRAYFSCGQVTQQP